MKNSLFKIKLNRRSPNVNRSIGLIFLAIILLGTLLLCLPFSSRNGKCCGFRVALFTATSSTCVTGLILADTWTQWSSFGQAVILCLIEIGGLGFMSAASFLIFALKKKMNMNQEMVIAQSIGADDMSDAVKVQKRMLVGCLSVEAIGALILAIRFSFDFDIFTSVKLGIFHSISAFCNAGFDILGQRYPGQSMIPYRKDPTVVITLSLLIIIGGIGFLVWNDIFQNKRPKKWNVYTKLVLIATLLLLVTGTAAFLFTERNNPDTLGNMSFGEKFISAFFQSSTTRTAGFDGLGQGKLTEGGKAVSVILMLIGGSSGSTAGGIKTVTFLVIILFLWSSLRGKSEINVFNRSVPKKQVLNALTVFCIVVSLAFFGGLFICITSPAVSFTDALYEASSAIATVGLTTGITPNLSVPAQFILIIYMYFGRVGILTLSLGFLNNKQSSQKYRYADTNLLIG